ncbi:sensor histidine kinase [Plantactinospora sp. S1510]|uniref:histidine kinase n=1 Tax=Plantactinospora alkalitolerans TaxID=2789879 RepID=A0ABS0GP98_9ACTN|nr:sensor histidine kinase [Plantactinospora alkalitolerans]MBF9128015.1 sensor histidine kinase [Plantactinospora alkalitolerans]
MHPARLTGRPAAEASIPLPTSRPLYDRLRRLRAGFGRRPRLADAGLVLLLMVLDGPAALAGGGVATWLSFAAVHVPLVWRRRAPVLVCWLVYALAIGFGVLVGIRVEGVYPEIVVGVAVYTAARYGPRRQLWPIVVAIQVPATVILLGIGPAWIPLNVITLSLAATVLLGIAISTRQAYLAEVAERARRLERDREQRAQLAVAAERARIARELHDIVAHNLAVMVALADGAAYTAASAPDRATETMRKVSATGRQALGEMRRLLGLLRDDAGGRAPQPGLGDLDALLNQVRAAGLDVVATVDGVPGASGPGAGLAVYRIVQEALTNTLKHAGPAARVQVRLHHRADGVDLEVVDDGARTAAAPPSGRGDVPASGGGDVSAPGGGDVSAPGGGHGLAGMIERATAYGGDVEVGPRTDGPGWRVRARLRFDEEGVA